MLQQLPEFIDSPLFWTNDELKELIGSPLYKNSIDSRQVVSKEYKSLFPILSEVKKKNPIL